MDQSPLYARPIQNKMVLVIVDSHLKWIEAHVVYCATLQATIEKLELMFATYGFPETIVYDNWTAFTIEEFATFIQSNGIKHLTSAPYHLASNRLAERAVQMLKNALKKNSCGESHNSDQLFPLPISSHQDTQLKLHLLNCSWRVS